MVVILWFPKIFQLKIQGAIIPHLIDGIILITPITLTPIIIIHMAVLIGHLIILTTLIIHKEFGITILIF